MVKKFKETINRYIPTLFLGAPISHMLILYSDKINEIISMNPILFALFLIPIILLLFASIIESENDRHCIFCLFMLFVISLLIRIFMNDSSKQPLETIITIILLICLGYMVSYIICNLCSRVYRFIVKIVCDVSKWIEYNENSISKSRFISVISMLLLIIISLSNFLNDILKIVNLFINTP